jgi:hypothetical protein
MMTGLKHHPSLETLMLSIPTRLYSVVMPCLDSIPKLQRISMDFISEIDNGDSADDEDSVDEYGDDGDNNNIHAQQQMEDDGTANDDEALLEKERLELAEAQALSELLGLADPRVHLRIEEFKCSSLRVKTALAAAILHAGINGLDARDCSFGGSATIFANVLIGARLKTLKINTKGLDRSVAIKFHAILAQGLSSMSLQTLELDNSSVDQGVLPVTDGTELIDIILAASRSPTMKRLKVTLINSEVVDNALSECLCTSGTLQDIELQCWVNSHLPAMEDSLKANYVVRRIVILRCRNDMFVPDKALQERLRPYLALNEAGRSYLVTDAGNKHVALRVLEQVNEDRDCLFIHLRENPTICGQIGQ